VLPPIAKGVMKNLSLDIAAKFSRRTYRGVAETTFDPFDAATAANPYPGYRQLLAGPRVHFNRRRSIFILSRHQDVRAAARADALLSSREGVVRSRVEVPILLNLDRPRHTELRRKVQPAFARGALQSWQPMVDRLARELVTGLLERPGSDVVQSLAVPMPMRMIAYILGVPPEDENFFRRWSNEAIRVANVQSTPRGLGQIAPTFYGVRQLHTYFQTQLERLSMKMSSRRGDRGGPVRAEFAAVAEQGPEHVDEAAGER
jgi:cytochrome P450